MIVRELGIENKSGSEGRLNEQIARSDVGEGGGGSQSPAYPSFLVLI
jgi:hypothetical protein